MKKLLLVLFVAFSAASYAQPFWEQVSTGFSTTSTTQGQISYADANVIWTYATPGDGSGDFYQFWGRSVDGGVTWTSGAINLGSVDLAIGSIHAVNATTAYIAVFPNAASVQGGIYITTNSGATWTKQTSASFNDGTNSFTNWVHFFDANNGVCQGDPANGYFEIYTTTNGGVNWVRVPSSAIPLPQDGEFGYTHNYEFVKGDQNSIWFGTNQGRIYRSTDKGLTWNVSQSPVTDFGGAATSASYAMKDASNGIFVSNDWQFFRTSDGTATWQSEIPGGGYYRNFDLAFVPGTANTYVNTGEDFDGIGRGSSYTTDGGLTFVDIEDDEPVDGGGQLEFYDPTHGLASGFTTSSTVGGIWRWLEDATTLANVDFQSTKLVTASPNPTTGSLDIAGKNITQVAVFDILGKQISNTSFGTLNNVNINLSSLNAGIYMVKVSNNEGATSTIKVVKK